MFVAQSAPLYIYTLVKEKLSFFFFFGRSKNKIQKKKQDKIYII